jgi:hypothetical protein
MSSDLVALPSALALQTERAGRAEFDTGLRLALDPSLLEALMRPRLSLLWGTQAPTRTLLTAATALVVQGTPVRLFDGGNAFDGYFVARLARRLVRITPRPSARDLTVGRGVTPRPSARDLTVGRGVTPRPTPENLEAAESAPASPAPGAGQDGPHEALSRLRLSRAFTCFQLAELIENTPSGVEPLFVLDLLATFYDESVPLRDSERLLAATLMHLKRLASEAPVIVGAHEPQTLVKERWRLLDHLQTAADAAWMLRAPEPEVERQMRLL